MRDCKRREPTTFFHSLFRVWFVLFFSSSFSSLRLPFVAVYVTLLLFLRKWLYACGIDSEYGMCIWAFDCYLFTASLLIRRCCRYCRMSADAAFFCLFVSVYWHYIHFQTNHFNKILDFTLIYLRSVVCFSLFWLFPIHIHFITMSNLPAIRRYIRKCIESGEGEIMLALDSQIT